MYDEMMPGGCRQREGSADGGVTNDVLEEAYRHASWVKVYCLACIFCAMDGQLMLFRSPLEMIARSRSLSALWSHWEGILALCCKRVLEEREDV